MTVGTLAIALGELARLLGAVHATSEAKGIRALEAFLVPHSEKKSAPFFAKAKPRREIGASWTGQRVGKILPGLESYQEMLERLAPKIGKELGLLVGFLRSHEGADLSDLIKAVEEALAAVPVSTQRTPTRSLTNEKIVADYVVRLKPALGIDAEFRNVFESLKANKAVRKQEVAEIARQMMPSPPTNIDRKKGLKAIQDLHIAAKGFDLKLKASRGRSAA